MILDTSDVAHVFGPLSEAAEQDQKAWKAMLKHLEALRDEDI